MKSELDSFRGEQNNP